MKETSQKFAVAMLLFAGVNGIGNGAIRAADDAKRVLPAAGPAVGDAAPVFKSIDERGQAWDSTDHVGKKYLVIYFYPGDFTSGCVKQAESFRDTMNLLADHGVAVVGVSGDPVRNHELFKESWKLNFTLLSDEAGDVAVRFGVPATAGSQVVPRGPDRKALTNEKENHSDCSARRPLHARHSSSGAMARCCTKTSRSRRPTTQNRF